LLTPRAWIPNVVGSVLPIAKRNCNVSIPSAIGGHTVLFHPSKGANTTIRSRDHL
jgi:hypothetical protein